MSRVPHRLPAAKLLLVGTAFALGGCQSVASMRDPYPHDYRQRHPIVVGPQGDLGAAPGSDSHLNRPSWNHGCAYQHNLAAIVANPNDLLGPRPETEIDASRRQTIMSRHRQGTAPGPQIDHQPIRSLTDIKREIKG
jgi:pilus assembly protein CpaD